MAYNVLLGNVIGECLQHDPNKRMSLIELYHKLELIGMILKEFEDKSYKKAKSL